MSKPLTSVSHPLRIDAVRPAPCCGRIGITLCPGKQDPHGITGEWRRDLDLDLDAVRSWGAGMLVSLITEPEMDTLGVRDLPGATASRGLAWMHLPIGDGRVPTRAFETAWEVQGAAIRERLRNGEDVVVHCRGGLGRAGTVAARLLIEFGDKPENAIRRVRAARPGAIETRAQEDYLRSLGRPPSR